MYVNLLAFSRCSVVASESRSIKISALLEILCNLQAARMSSEWVPNVTLDFASLGRWSSILVMLHQPAQDAIPHAFFHQLWQNSDYGITALITKYYRSHPISAFISLRVEKNFNLQMQARKQIQEIIIC